MNSADSTISSNSTLLTSSTWKDRKRHTATAEQLADWQEQYQQHFGWLNQLYFNHEFILKTGLSGEKREAWASPEASV